MTDEQTTEPTQADAANVELVTAIDLSVVLGSGAGVDALLMAMAGAVAKAADEGLADLLDYLTKGEHAKCETPELCRRGGVVQWAEVRDLEPSHLEAILGSAVNALLRERALMVAAGGDFEIAHLATYPREALEMALRIGHGTPETAV